MLNRTQPPEGRHRPVHFDLLPIQLTPPFGAAIFFGRPLAAGRDAALAIGAGHRRWSRGGAVAAGGAALAARPTGWLAAADVGPSGESVCGAASLAVIAARSRAGAPAPLRCRGKSVASGCAPRYGSLLYQNRNK